MSKQKEENFCRYPFFGLTFVYMKKKYYLCGRLDELNVESRKLKVKSICTQLLQELVRVVGMNMPE